MSWYLLREEIGRNTSSHCAAFLNTALTDLLIICEFKEKVHLVPLQ